MKHSYWWKSWNQPHGLYTTSQDWNSKNLFNLPQVTNKCWTLWPSIGPKAEKGIPSNLGNQFANLGASVSAFINIPTSKVIAFISNLGPNNKPQMLKVSPKFFRFWLLVRVILRFWKFWICCLYWTKFCAYLAIFKCAIVQSMAT